jgi:putative ABC transport system ATP-binding protein
MLKICGITKSFGEHSVLAGVDFSAEDGLLTILEGQNGAGKSTLFNILSGTLSPDKGSICLDDFDIAAISARDRAAFMAVLKQDPKTSSSPTLSVFENCALANLKNRSATLALALRESVRHQIIQHLSSLELDFTKHLDRPMGELSGGQRQILAFAMATMIKPRLLLLDEPSAALDEKSSHLLMRLIKRLISQWQIPAVMISHDHGLNQNYGDKIKILENGVILPS